MSSISPATSSPADSPFNSSARRKFASKVYARRPTLGSASASKNRTLRASFHSEGDIEDDASELTDEEEEEEEEEIEEAKDKRRSRRERDQSTPDGSESDGDLLLSPTKLAQARMRKAGALFPTTAGEGRGTKSRARPARNDRGADGQSKSKVEGGVKTYSSKRAVTYVQPTKRTRSATQLGTSTSPDERLAATSSVSTSDRVPPIKLQPASSSPSILGSSQPSGTAGESGPSRLARATAKPDTSGTTVGAISSSDTPSTPPRKRHKVDPRTPIASPRNLSALFAAVSPAGASPGRVTAAKGSNEQDGHSESGQVGASNSRGKSGLTRSRTGGAGGEGLLRRMLDKSQSLGNIHSSPGRKGEKDGVEDIFGSDISGPDSPSPRRATDRSISRTQSLPSTPSKTPKKVDFWQRAGQTNEDDADEGRGDMEANPSLLLPGAGAGSSTFARSASGSGGSGGRAKRTYGGARSFLSTTEVVEVEVEDRNRVGREAKGGGGVKESYAELRKKYEVDNSGGDEDSQGNLLPDLLLARAGQTVADMRSKGENRRFMDEISDMLDPMLDSATSMGLKRSSAYDLLRSAQAAEWLDRAMACGQVERIWEALYAARGEGGDEIIDAICLLYLARLIRSGFGIVPILRAYDESCVRLVLHMMRVLQGSLDPAPVTARKTSGIATKLRTAYQRLGIPWSPTPMTSRRLAAFVLAHLAEPGQWDIASSALSSEGAVQRAVKSLKRETDLLEDRFDLVEKGLELITPDKPVDVENVLLIITFFNSVTQHDDLSREVLLSAGESLAAAMITVLIAAGHLVWASDSEYADVVKRIATATLRLLAFLTNTSPSWAAAVSSASHAGTVLARIMIHRADFATLSPSPPPAATDDPDDPFTSPVKITRKKSIAGSASASATSADDILVAAVIVLTMAALAEDAFCASVAKTKLSSECRGIKRCLRECQCASKRALAQHLISIHLEYTNSLEPERKLVGAYIGILLAQLLHAVHASRQAILSSIPGEQYTAKIANLISVLCELNTVQLSVYKGMVSLLSAQKRDEGENGGEENGSERVYLEAMDGDEGIVQAAIRNLDSIAAEMQTA